MRIRLEQGELTQCPEGSQELIYGIPYDKEIITEQEADIVRFIYSAFSQYRLARRPLDVILEPQAPLRFPETPGTFTRPEIAVMRNGDEFPTWIAEFVNENSFEIAMMLKPMLYRDTGVLEYWVIDAVTKVLYVYDLRKAMLIPKVYKIPQRIPVGIYKDLLLPYSSIFQKR